METCIYKNTCPAYGTDKCNPVCRYFLVTHGENGNGGFWKTRNVPKKYDTCFSDTLPTGKQFDIIRKYIEMMPTKVEEGVGLYLYSAPTKDNEFGTGNGKTTSAVTILNEWTRMQCVRFSKQLIQLKHNPSLFMKCSDFQNLYNSQFRGHPDLQSSASSTYYRYKDLMKNVQLLVLDDIAIRTATEAFMNEMYELIEHRASEDLATIFTSNVSINKLKDIFGDRIASRIDGMTIPVAFQGKDYRRKSL